EGFLPGYNFPRLPLMAYIPGTPDGGGRKTYLQRPRFLALAEFGPRSLIYHEGRSYRVVRALLALGQRDAAGGDVKLATETVRICRACGAGHFNEELSTCHGCRNSLDTAEIIHDVYRIENVDTQPTERITADDEERQRQGFELQTTFRWATRGGSPDVRHGGVFEGDDAVLNLSYGTSAEITRINKGLRRRANRSKYGFMINPLSGMWAKNADEEGDADPTAVKSERIVPCVRDRKNALLVLPADPDLPPKTLTTLQHALLRGIETECQLEPGEILAEPMPSRDDRKGLLLYEAAEGGAGVLNRLVSEPDLLPRIGRRALSIMHFALEGETVPSDPHDLRDVEGTSCVAACYRCLMSYYNQPDHEDLDRRDAQAKQLLLRLARAATRLEEPASRAAEPSGPHTTGDTSGGGLLDAVARRDLPPPDAEPRVVDGYTIPAVWHEHYVAAVSADVPESATGDLADKGFLVVQFPADEADWPAPLDELARALGARES
ncbi:MAG: DUF1998 domain-containing protein, partial [Myxococcales bacterium FL481]